MSKEKGFIVVQGGTKINGEKFEKTRKVEVGENLTDLNMLGFSDEVIHTGFVAELRRQVASELRREIEQEHGVRKISKTEQRVRADVEKETIQAMLPTLDALKLDYSGCIALADYQALLASYAEGKGK